MRTWLSWLLGLAVLTLAARGSAHGLSRSHSQVRLAGTLGRVTLLVPLTELERAGLAPRRALPEQVAWGEVARRLSAALVVGNAGDECHAHDEAARATTSGAIATWRVVCGRAPEPRVTLSLFFATAPGHLHQCTLHQDARSGEVVLSADRPSAALTAGAPSHTPSFAGFVRAGLVHVATGWDHVAFLLALVLLGASDVRGAPRTAERQRVLSAAKRVAWIATAFTLGHGGTLALAATGTLRPLDEAIELLVALSVAYSAIACFAAWGGARHAGLANAGLHALAIALAAGHGRADLAVLGSLLITSCHLVLSSRTARGSAPALLAACFGLVHGFAFSGGLRDLLGAGRLLPALAGFNLGVELAQLAILTLGLASLSGLGLLVGATRARYGEAAIASAVALAGTAAVLLRAGAAG